MRMWRRRTDAIPRNIEKDWNKGVEKLSNSPVNPRPFIVNIIFEVKEERVPPANAARNTRIPLTLHPLFAGELLSLLPPIVM